MEHIPKAAKKKKVKRIHSYELVDSYSWLEQKKKKEVIDYIIRENQYTEFVMKDTKKLQREIFKELKTRINPDEVSFPYFTNGYYYFSEYKKNMQYKIHYRYKNKKQNKKIIFDENKFSKNFDYFSFGGFKVSPNNKYLMYTFDKNGFRNYKLEIKNLKTNKVFFRGEFNVRSFEWVTNDQVVFVIEDLSKRAFKILTLDLLSFKTSEVFVEKDEKFSVYIYKSLDNRYLYINSESSLTSENYFIDINRVHNSCQLKKPTLIRKRKVGVEYSVEHLGEFLLELTNVNGPNFELRLLDQNFKLKKVLIKHNKNIFINYFEIYEKYVVLKCREKGYQSLKILDRKSFKITEIQLPQKVASFYGQGNYQHSSNIYTISYQSFLLPKRILQINFKTKDISLKKISKIKEFDENKYSLISKYALAHDGEKIPITVIFKKGIDKKKAPCYLSAYGSYGISMDPHFNSNSISLLDRGFIVAIAHVRGGGENGKLWHIKGRLKFKQNTFRDFIACSIFLKTKVNYKSRKIIIQGGSAGGLLIGAVLNKRPSLFNGAILDVPFVDVVNTMLNKKLPLTVGEYEEWGNPNIKKDFEYIKKYCPYSNLDSKSFPPLLILTSINDSQVMYWEPTKYIAKLREKKKGDSPKFLYHCNMSSGHSGASGRYDYLEEISFKYSFILKTLSMVK